MNCPACGLKLYLPGPCVVCTFGGKPRESLTRDRRGRKRPYSATVSRPATGVRTKEAGCPDLDPAKGLTVATNRRQALDGLSTSTIR